MRWRSRPKMTKKDVGRLRVVERFLWFPKCLNGEWRWWERVKIIQTIVQYDVGGSMEWGKFAYPWVDQAWAREDEDARDTLERRRGSDLGRDRENVQEGHGERGESVGGAAQARS
jgi:hypothetical protein